MLRHIATKRPRFFNLKKTAVTATTTTSSICRLQQQHQSSCVSPSKSKTNSYSCEQLSLSTSAAINTTFNFTFTRGFHLGHSHSSKSNSNRQQNINNSNNENNTSTRNYNKFSVELDQRSLQLVLRCSNTGTNTNTSNTDNINTNVNANPAGVNINKGEETLRVLPLVWLRDHCRCADCYNHETSQKAFLIDPFEQDLAVSNVTVSEEEEVHIQWRDGHKSQFTVDWLLQHSFHGEARPPLEQTLWEADSMRHRLPTTSFGEHMETEEGRLHTIRSIVQYGFAFVNEVPPTVEGTQQAVERIVPLQDTFFDQGMWTFTSDGAHSDTAWGTQYIGPHTDNTYLEIPAGFQVFQCLHHDGEGGETLLVDGFKVIEDLKETHPEAVKILSSHLVPHEYIEPPMHGRPGFHMHTLSHIVKLHPATDKPIHFRFNPYDRAPLDTIPPEKIPEFYEAYHRLFTAVNDPRYQLWVKLKPGTVVFIDNWRVMHGRGGFNGKRMMAGCYTRRDDWMSTARILDLVSTTH